MTSYRISFITPLFSKGSYDNLPEVRPPSIRGQLHWWFRALGGSYVDERAIFGGVHGGATASKVVLRVNNVTGQTGEVATLPHKSRSQSSPKWAYKPGTKFDLHISWRLGGLDKRLQTAFDRTFETWLLLGTLGLRATRGGGSFSWKSSTIGAPQMPESIDTWKARCCELITGAALKFYIANKAYATAEEARRDVSDTIGGRGEDNRSTSLAQIKYPLGVIGRGLRKTSPLRFRIIPIADSYHIAALWDDRTAVTGNKPSDLDSVIRLLADKPLGRLLQGFR